MSRSSFNARRVESNSSPIKKWRSIFVSRELFVRGNIPLSATCVIKLMAQKNIWNTTTPLIRNTTTSSVTNVRGDSTTNGNSTYTRNTCTNQKMPTLSARSAISCSKAHNTWHDTRNFTPIVNTFVNIVANRSNLDL
uniref:(northern house mosquito) hypothetical protein n=1 Tax=Culex pipiens TaxID=7175 RepID=A0A8D8D522_CULPI